MHTQKVAITMPEMVLKEVDTLSKLSGISRSRYITLAVREKLENEKKRMITESYNKVFSSDDICKEQLEMASNFDTAGFEGGQEW